MTWGQMGAAPIGRGTWVIMDDPTQADLERARAAIQRITKSREAAMTQDVVVGGGGE